MTSKSSNVELLKAWFHKGIPCVPGKREYATGRYFMAEVTDPSSTAVAYASFIEALKRREAVACIFVASETVALPRTSDVSEQFRQCAELMRDISDVSPEALVNGGRLGKKIELECPVTGAMRIFDDFDAFAFCPQSYDEGDPLYDPMMGTPVPCVNFSSDIYAFAMFTRDVSLRLKRQEIVQLDAADRKEVFEKAARQWQHFAKATIMGYMEITDLARCPVSLVDNDRIWYANHQDPAFAEKIRTQFAHQMPVLYTPRIIAGWEAYFETGQQPGQAAEEITPFGFKRPKGEFERLHT